MDRFPKAFPKDYDAILPLERDIDADIRERGTRRNAPADRHPCRR